MPVKAADFADPVIRASWIRDKGMMVFQLYNDQLHQGVDVFADYPLDFDTLWRDSVPVALGPTSSRIASIDHLIMMKQQAGRPQDLIDIEKLKKLKLILAERSVP